MTSAEYIYNTLFEKINALKYENEELKAKVEALQSGNEVCWQGDMDRTIAQNLELKKQVKILEDRIAQEYIKSDDQLHEMYDREENLISQIEAMKNCENCDRVNCWQCKKNDKWSLYVQR